MQAAVCVHHLALRVPLGTRRVGTARTAFQAVSSVMKPNTASSVEAPSTYRMAYALPIVQSVHSFSLPLISLFAPLFMYTQAHKNVKQCSNTMQSAKQQLVHKNMNTSSSLHNVHMVNRQQFECHLPSGTKGR